MEITVFDTPGLADGTGNEEEYLEKIKEKVTDLDVFIFCTEMNARRFRNDDIKTLQKLTEVFSSKLWEHAVVALTFANEVYPSTRDKKTDLQEFFDKRVRDFKKKIHKVLFEVGVQEKVVINVPFVAAGDLSELKLPGVDNWLTAFWVATFRRLNRSAQSAFVLANVNRLKCISSSEQIPKRDNSFGTGLPAGEFPEGNQVQEQTQRESFPGNEAVYHDQCSDENADSVGAHRPLTGSGSPSNPEPRATNPSPNIILDESCAKEIKEGFMLGVAAYHAVKFAGQFVADVVVPGLGTLIGTVCDFFN